MTFTAADFATLAALDFPTECTEKNCTKRVARQAHCPNCGRIIVGPTCLPHARKTNRRLHCLAQAGYLLACRPCGHINQPTDLAWRTL
ncbi:hypothetical protein ACQBAU_16180 [Propionibacteriaceae bacterium Y2011]